MLELQQQLCDAESAAESLRDANSDLRSANRDLTSKLDILESDDAKETYETMWRQSQVLPVVAPLFEAHINVHEKLDVWYARSQMHAPWIFPHGLRF